MMTLVSEGVPWTLLERSSEHWPHFSSAHVRSEDLWNGYYPMKRTLERKIRRRNIDCTRRYTFSSIRDICRTFPISEIIALCWSRRTIAIFSSSSTTLSSSWKIVNNGEAQRTTIKKFSWNVQAWTIKSLEKNSLVLLLASSSTTLSSSWKIC